MIDSPRVHITSLLQTHEYLACHICSPGPVLCSCCCCCWRLDPLFCLSEVRMLLFSFHPCCHFYFSFMKTHLLIKFQGKHLSWLATVLPNLRSFYFRNYIEWVVCMVVFSDGEFARDSSSSAFHTRRNQGTEQSAHTSAAKRWQKWVEDSQVDLHLDRALAFPPRPHLLSSFLLTRALIRHNIFF